MSFSWLATDLASPPAADQLEVSVFGRGVGECVVVHLGGGHWAVVDSCLEPDSKRPVALHYLDVLGVDVAHQVDLVVATHWHDDHVRGAASLLDAASSAKLVCSAALNSGEFQKLVGASRSVKMGPSGLDEFVETMRLIKTRTSNGLAPRTWAKADTCLFRSEHGAMHALSPSDSTMTVALEEIAALLPKEGAPKRRAVAQRPNELSVALWVRLGEARALLGADLERGRNAGSGWQAVLGSTTRPPGRAELIKVPHHGSPNADLPEVWSDLLVPEPTAVVSCFSAGKRPLPADSDLGRLAGRAGALFRVGPRSGRKLRGLPPPVRRIVRQVAPSLREDDGRLGMVRVRLSSTGDREVHAEVFGVAERVTRAA